MKEKVQKAIYIIFIFSLILGSLVGHGTVVLAASAAMNLSLSEENILVDNTFSVVLTIESSEDIGDVEAFLSFNRDMLQFVEGGAFITEGEGMVLISDIDSGETGLRKSYSLTFRAIKGGETTISISKRPLIFCALDDKQMSVSNNPLMFQIVDPVRISDDTELEELTVFPGTLKPEFKNTIYKYTMEVDTLDEKVAVHGKASDNKATVSIKGNTKLKIGKNNIKITVTAPSGDKKTTTITVTRKAPGEDESQDEELEIEGTDLNVEIPPTGVWASDDEEGNYFLSETLNLKILPIEEETIIPKDYEKTNIVLNGLPITVYCWKYDLDSDVLLVYGENQDGETGFYQYNRVNQTLKKYNGIIEEDTLPVKTPDMKESAKEDSYKRRIFQMGILSGGLFLVCMGLTISLTFQIMKQKAGKEEKEDDFFL